MKMATHRHSETLGQCEVFNGLPESEINRRRLTGTIGTGEGRLSLTTHNGSVRIKEAG